MSTPADQPPQPQKRNSKIERALVLRDAVEHAVRAQREIATRRPSGGGRAGRSMLLAFCTTLTAFCAYSFIAKPEFIWGARVPVVPAARAEASMRVAMYMVARRAELQRDPDGSYPETLHEFSPDTSVLYRTTDSGFEIVGRANGSALVLRSTDDLTAFLGNSIELIQERVGR